MTGRLLEYLIILWALRGTLVWDIGRNDCRLLLKLLLNHHRGSKVPEA